MFRPSWLAPPWKALKTGEKTTSVAKGAELVAGVAAEPVEVVLEAAQRLPPAGVGAVEAVARLAAPGVEGHRPQRLQGGAHLIRPLVELGEDLADLFRARVGARGREAQQPVAVVG